MKGSKSKGHLKTTGARGLLALLGLTLALLGSSPIEPPAQADNVLVWVNKHPVTSEQLAFVTKRLTGVSPDSFTTQQRRSVLELLVDEELLLQRAETLGLHGADPGIRKALVQAEIDRVVAEFRATPVDVGQLRHFYRQHQAVFERPMRVAVEVLRFDSLQDAQRAHASLSGGADFADIGHATDARKVSHLPSSPLPAHMLRRYLGSTLTDIALTLDQGEISNPIQQSDGVHVLRASVVTPAEVPDFDEVRAVVEREYQRRGRDRALEEKLLKLWTKADVDFNPGVTGGLLLAVERGPGPADPVNNMTAYEDTD